MKEVSLAPMYKVTKPAFRELIRSLSKDVLMFTELIVDSTINHVTDERILTALGEPEDGTVVQVGGSDPDNVAIAVKRLVDLGYKEFNLNCGCPSNKVQKGLFGAVLMQHKELVADVVNKVYEKSQKVISIKTRVGVDNDDSYEFFESFITHIANNTPCKKFYIHARKCWLKGLNPKQNRNIPLLNYDFCYKLKEKHPELTIVLNGGINNENAWNVIKNLDGIMIGREAVNDVLVFNKILDEKVDYKKAISTYLDNSLKHNFHRHTIYVPLMTLYKGTPKNKLFKRLLVETMANKTGDLSDANERIKNFINDS